jgi:hypothetical protein
VWIRLLTTQLDELEELSERHQRKIAILLREIDAKDEKMNRQDIELHRITNQLRDLQMQAMQRDIDDRRNQHFRQPYLDASRHQHPVSYPSHDQGLPAGPYQYAGHSHHSRHPHITYHSAASTSSSSTSAVSETKYLAGDSLLAQSSSWSSCSVSSWIDAGDDVVSTVLADCESTIVSIESNLFMIFKPDLVLVCRLSCVLRRKSFSVEGRSPSPRKTRKIAFVVCARITSRQFCCCLADISVFVRSVRRQVPSTSVLFVAHTLVKE